MLRLFVGLPLPPAIKNDLTLIASGIENARWIAPENLHLTLRFIGDCDEGEVEDIDAVLRSIDTPSFPLALGFEPFTQQDRTGADPGRPGSRGTKIYPARYPCQAQAGLGVESKALP